MREMKNKKAFISREKAYEFLFLIFVFAFLFIWAMKAPLNASPDEEMRFRLTDYIVRHGELPDGRDPEIRNPQWGISYAFKPYTSCIVSAGFGWLATLFTDDFDIYYKSMRLTNVLFGTLLAFIVLRLGKRLFEKEKAWFFTVLVTFLPGAAFLHTYQNMDSLALLATAWIFYCWVRAVQEGWTGKVCVQLGLAMSLCVMSYYNAYGFLLCSALLFAGMMLKCGEQQWNYQEMLKKGFLMLGIVLLFTGWWFIRNGMMYDGDILGMTVSDHYAEMYAIPELKPSNRETPKAIGMSLAYMLFWKPETWQYNWMGTVVASFIGMFGFMDIFMPEIWTKAYVVFFALGAVGNLFCIRKYFFVANRDLGEERIQDEKGELVIRKYRKEKVWNSMNLLRLCLLLAIIIPVILLLYYAYASDFQAQGRYIMPGLLPIMYFITMGYEVWLDKLVKNERSKRIFFRVSSVLLAVSCVLVYGMVYAPNY